MDMDGAHGDDMAPHGAFLGHAVPVRTHQRLRRRKLGDANALHPSNTSLMRQSELAGRCCPVLTRREASSSSGAAGGCSHACGNTCCQRLQSPTNPRCPRCPGINRAISTTAPGGFHQDVSLSHLHLAFVQAWFELPLLPGKPLEPIFKIFFTFVGICGELWVGQKSFT